MYQFYMCLYFVLLRTWRNKVDILSPEAYKESFIVIKT